MSDGQSHYYVMCAAIILVATLALATAASLNDIFQLTSTWYSEVALLPVADAAAGGASEPLLEWDGGVSDHATRHTLHRPADLHLHPSTLSMSSYPVVGGGAAELIFTVTYAGDMRRSGIDAQGPVEPPVVRLDITGSGYRDLYRVTNITSNIGTEALDVFEPYDHETETVKAERGATYTVRALIEFTAEGFVPVYARGFDGDIVTVTVAASHLISMPYSEYVEAQQVYLNSDFDGLSLDSLHESPVLEKRRDGASRTVNSSLLNTPVSIPPLAESTMWQTFNATGIVMAENNTGELVPVHGINVCVYDRSPALSDTLLFTTTGELACGYTDPNGRYNIPHVNGGDPHDMTAVDVVVSVLSYGYNDAIKLVWYNSNDLEIYLYYVDSDVDVNYGGSLLVNNFDLRDGDIEDVGMANAGMAGAARIIDALSDGMAFFEAYGQDSANLAVGWNYMEGASVFPLNDEDGAAYYKNRAAIYFDGNNTISTYDESFDRHTILHELGHHVHFTHDSSGLDYDCFTHHIAKKYDERCAWGEGWANLVPHLVDDAAEVPLGVQGKSIHIEDGGIISPNRLYITPFDKFESSGRPIGEKVEGSVAAAMWDMLDDAVHPVYDAPTHSTIGGDNSSAGVDVLLNIFFTGRYDTFASFYDRWEIDVRHDSAEDIAILHGMSFAIPSNMSYYEFVSELGGIYKHRISQPLQFKSFSDELEFYRLSNLMQFKPNYVAVSDNDTTVAVTSTYGLGLQMVDAHSEEHKGLYATHGHSHLCTLDANPLMCNNPVERQMSDLGPAEFSSMNSIAFGLNSTVILVSDGHQDRIQALGFDGSYLGQFGTTGDGDGEFGTPDGITFLDDDTTVAVADTANSRIQTFKIASDSNARYDDQFLSYNATQVIPGITRQQLATGSDGTLYAAGYGQPSIWMYPPPYNTSIATRINDPSLCNLGGIAVDRDGLVYVSDPDRGRVRVYDPDNLRGSVNDMVTQLGERPMTLRQVQDGSGLVGCSLANTEAFIDEFGSLGSYPWQLRNATGLAIGSPDVHTGDVRVYVADQSGVKIYEKDREGPRVELVWAHTPDGTVVEGDTVEIAVKFSERVTVTGTPVLALDTGAAGSTAVYVSGSGSHTLTFNHTINAGAGQSYIDYNGTGSLSLSGDGADASDAIIDGSGNVANLTLPERGTAASLAANAALWIDASRTDVAPFGIAATELVEVVEHRQVMFTVSTVDGGASAAPGSYSMEGAPAGATILPNGTFVWTPREEQDGMHAFVVHASAQGDSGTQHARTFRIQVAEDNAVPKVEPVPDVRASALSEIKFNIVATDADMPAQDLGYWLVTNTSNNYAVVLPNGTFVWTPSVYNIGTTSFNVTVIDEFVSSDDGVRDTLPFAEFNVVVGPPFSPVLVYVLMPDGLGSSEQDFVYTANQTIRIAVDFSEPIVVPSDSRGAPYLELRTGAAGGSRASYDSGSGTKTLVFTYTVRDGDATDHLSYAGSNALSLNGSTMTVLNSGEAASTTLPETGSLGSLSDSSRVRIDAIRPAIESVYALSSNGTYSEGMDVSIAARFSENVTVVGTPAIALEIGTADRMAEFDSGNSTDTLVFRYTVQASDSASRLDYVGTDALRTGTGGSIRDGVGNNAVLTLPAPGSPGSLGYNSNITINIDSGNETTDNSVTLNVGQGSDTGLISVVESGDGARIVLNLRGIAGPSGSGSVMFPTNGVTINASFASVTFPPGAMATSVPADNTLVMYVADGVPDNSSIQSVLGYDGSNPVVLQRVVEIGDEDGRVEFDVPVRISLDGQAGGRAFYVDGISGAINPIDRACAADDLQRVQRQLNGAGECQLDSAGGDKIIYTYHLTRFGTVLSEGGTLATPDHTCSVRLMFPNLEMDARLGDYSPATSQAVVNSGSLPFSRIELDATPWYVNLVGEPPGLPGTMLLPASISEVSEEGEEGAYITVGEGGTGVLRGLEGGGQKPLWFRMNLVAHGDLQSGVLTQYVTYMAECGGPAERQ